MSNALCILIKLCILIVMFLYSYCYVCSVLGILFHCVVLCTIYVQISTLLLPPGVKPIAVKKYIIYHSDYVASIVFRSPILCPPHCSTILTKLKKKSILSDIQLFNVNTKFSQYTQQSSC